MSSFFDDASLVMIPSGYKTSKVYSVKPTDGTGDLAFSRSNDTATRVGPDGLIEKVRTNLYPRGSALLSTGWTSAGATLTAGQTDPDGGTGALRVQLIAGTSFLYQGFSGSSTYNRSVYIKAATAQTIKLVEPFTGAFVLCNLTTSYQRFNLSAVGAGALFGIQFDNTNDSAAKDFTIAFVQIEEGDIATPYIPTTTAAVSVGPVANVPRLDYTNSTCPKLLLEPQRTNVFTFSNTFSNAAWDKGGVTVTGGQVGVNTSNDAFLMTEDSANNVHRMQQTPVISGVSTISVYAKANTRNFLYLRGVQGAANARAWFNLSTGTVGTLEGGATAKMTASANGYYRCEMTLNHDLGFELYIGMSSTNGGLSYQGNGTGSIFVQNAQAEVGASATSYIPTLGAAVTRGADAASKTGISSLIGQSEGTVFVELPLQYLNFIDYRGIISVSDGTFDNGAFVFVNNAGGSSNQFSSVYRASATTVASFQAANLSNANIGSTYKIAIAYKANDFVFYINGVQIGSDTSGAIVGTLSRLDVGSIGYSGLSTVDRQTISQALIFPTRLTNAQLAELTA